MEAVLTALLTSALLAAAELLIARLVQRWLGGARPAVA